jgi:hypothetical protein
VANTVTFLNHSRTALSAPGIVTQRILLSGNISVCSFRSDQADAVLHAKMTIVAPASKSFCTHDVVKAKISSGVFAPYGQLS